MPAKESITKTGCVVQRANCETCGWSYENRKNGLAIAKKHHNKTGHKVTIEITNIVVYEMKDSP